MIHIGIDNGVTGAIGIIDEEGVGYLFQMPTKFSLNYQKTQDKHITRVDVKALRELLLSFLAETDVNQQFVKIKPCKLILERPMVNPLRFIATTSALRALESTLNVVESLGIGYDYIDSKTWQSALLPTTSQRKLEKGEKRTDKEKVEYMKRIKEVSKQVGMRKYPNINWGKFKDADAILIAEYSKLKWSKE